MSSFYMPCHPITEDDDKDWISQISRKFKKKEIVEKLNSINNADFNPKATKKTLVEALLYSLREQIDDMVTNNDDDVKHNDDDDDDDDDDEPYLATDDPSYRSELDGDLDDDDVDDIEIDGHKDNHHQHMPCFISSWKDPTFLFCVGTLMSVVFVRGNSDKQELQIVPLNELPGQLQEHFFDPIWLLGGLFLYVAYYYTKDYVSDSFSSATRMEAGWYLWNGAVIHVMMDGCAGGGWFNAKEGGGWGMKLMNANYQVLDKRFARTAPSGEIAIATVVTQTELFCHSILCLIAYIGICKRAKWADAVALIALSFQLFGAIVFIVPDLITGCPNMQPFDVNTCLPDATMFTFFYFWFGVGCNILWVAIPIKFMADIIKRQ